MGAEYVVSVPVCLCVCLSVRDHIFGTTRAIFAKFLCMSPMTVARSPSDVVIRYALPVLWMTSYLLISQGCSTLLNRSANAALGLAINNAQSVIPVAAPRTHGTTFMAHKVTTQVETPGAESAVYDCRAVGTPAKSRRRAAAISGRGRNTCCVATGCRSTTFWDTPTPSF